MYLCVCVCVCVCVCDRQGPGVRVAVSGPHQRRGSPHGAEGQETEEDGVQEIVGNVWPHADDWLISGFGHACPRRG